MSEFCVYVHFGLNNHYKRKTPVPGARSKGFITILRRQIHADVQFLYDLQTKVVRRTARTIRRT